LDAEGAAEELAAGAVAAGVVIGAECSVGADASRLSTLIPF